MFGASEWCHSTIFELYAIIVGKLLHRTPNTHGVHMWILWKWEIKYGIALLVQMLANMQQWL